jgi:hypothetical protein
MSDAITLSEMASNVLRRRYSGQRVEVTDDTREHPAILFCDLR